MGNNDPVSNDYLGKRFNYCFEPVNYQPISGANTHNFSKSFVWDGTSNIIVQVCHTNDVTNWGNKYTSNARSNTQQLRLIVL
jgi:hypothetical protein